MFIKSIIRLNIIVVALAASFTMSHAAGKPAPNFTVSTGNKTIKLSDYKGKVIYLDFFASWCVPCRKSFPWLNSMHKRYKNKGLVVLAINLDKNKADAKRFLSKYPANFIVGYDPEGKVAGLYQLPGMPSSFLIDKKGNIVSSHVGFHAEDSAELEQEIKNLLR